MATSPSDLFTQLGAPLNNVQWSWGARRGDGVIFLRVWQDETMRLGDRTFVRLVNRRAYAAGPINHGYQERLDHLRAVADGAPAYAVMCRAKDAEAQPRTIKSFERRDLLRLGEIRLVEGDEWAAIVDRVPARTLAP